MNKKYDISSVEKQTHFWLRVFPAMTLNQKNKMFRRALNFLRKKDGLDPK